MSLLADEDALPLPHATVVHALFDAANRSPLSPALRCDGEALSYLGYARCVAGFAYELAGLGDAGDRVAVLMGNSIDMAIASFAVQAAGFQLVPLNPAYTAFELAPILDNAQPIALIHDDGCAPQILAQARQQGVTRLIGVGPAHRLLRWADQPVDWTGLALPDPQALSTLQYTGGTTGRSKGVNLTHHAVCINVRQREALLPTRADCERVLLVTPMFHVYAVSMGLYLTVFCRGELVILPRYRPDAVLQAIEQRRITLFSGSPTIFIGLMGHPQFAYTDLSSLRLCYSGSAALPVETLQRWETATACPIVEGYGQSEAGPVLTFNPCEGVRKVGSVGIVVPQTEVQIVDVETGRHVLAAGALGEIRARGPQLMRGYRLMPDETAVALRDGWLYTGDIGMLDDDGYLYIRDRKKDMVIVGGYNVYPRELEEVLYTHPAVQEVAVVGRPDPYRGEVLVVFVVVSKSVQTETLHAYLAERLVKYKLPAQWVMMKVLPKTEVGKINKVRLREIAAASPA